MMVRCCCLMDLLELTPHWKECLGSTIVDGPEVPEDRDPAQREAEGPRSSMDYSEFPMLDFSHQKKKSVTTPRNRRCPMKGQRSRWRYMEKTEYSCIMQL